MKKFLILVAAAFITVNANAQWFLGGNVGISVNDVNKEGTGENNDQTFKNNAFSFTVAPKFGYYFNEKIALGASLSFRVGTSLVVEPNFMVNGVVVDELKNRGFSIGGGIYPFVRYSVFTYKKFSIQLEGSLGVGYEYGKQKISTTLTNMKGTANYSEIGITILNVVPIISFNLSEHFQLETSLNFFNLGYAINIKNEETDNFLGMPATTAKNVTHNFITGFKSSHAVSMYGLVIGAIYKF